MRNDLSVVQTPDPRRPYGTCRHMGSIPLLPQYVVGVPTQFTPQNYLCFFFFCIALENWVYRLGTTSGTTVRSHFNFT